MDDVWQMETTILKAMLSGYGGNQPFCREPRPAFENNLNEYKTSRSAYAHDPTISMSKATE
jgi:hypothetical protein